MLHCDIFADFGHFVGAGQENEKDNKITRHETSTDLYSYCLQQVLIHQQQTLQVAIFLFLVYHKAQDQFCNINICLKVYAYIGIINNKHKRIHCHTKLLVEIVLADDYIDRWSNTVNNKFTAICNEIIRIESVATCGVPTEKDKAAQ